MAVLSERAGLPLAQLLDGPARGTSTEFSGQAIYGDLPVLNGPDRSSRGHLLSRIFPGAIREVDRPSRRLGTKVRVLLAIPPLVAAAAVAGCTDSAPAASPSVSQSAVHSPHASPAETQSPQPLSLQEVIKIGIDSEIQAGGKMVDFALLTQDQLKGLDNRELTGFANFGRQIGIVINPQFGTDRLLVNQSAIVQYKDQTGMETDALFGILRLHNGSDYMTLLPIGNLTNTIVDQYSIDPNGLPYLLRLGVSGIPKSVAEQELRTLRYDGKHRKMNYDFIFTVAGATQNIRGITQPPTGQQVHGPKE